MRGVSVVIVALMALYVIVSGLPVAQAQATIDQRVFEQLSASASGEATFLVFLAGRPDLSRETAIADRQTRKMAVARALKAGADRAQAPALARLAELTARGQVSRYQAFFVGNVISVTGREGAVLAMSQTAGVSRIAAEGRAYADGTLVGPAGPPSAAVEPNIAHVNAPDAWALGYKGQKQIVGGLDSGVRYTHEALNSRYKCRTQRNHNKCWLDAISGLKVPYDDNFHGTHTIGTALGTKGIGVAKGAKWIACKFLNSGGSGSFTDAFECANWFLSLALDDNTLIFTPDVINNSWSCGRDCATFNPAVDDWADAGIIPAFSVGNMGPSCMTSRGPGEYTRSFASGASFPSTDIIASFSSRGPASAINGGTVKPDVTSPGQNIRSATNASDTSYGFASGTSMASPHTAGAGAVVLSKNNGLDPTQVRSIIEGAALNISDLTCGGSRSNNNVWGEGRLDAVNDTP